MLTALIWCKAWRESCFSTGRICKSDVQIRAKDGLHDAPLSDKPMFSELLQQVLPVFLASITPACSVIPLCKCFPSHRPPSAPLALACCRAAEKKRELVVVEV